MQEPSTASRFALIGAGAAAAVATTTIIFAGLPLLARLFGSERLLQLYNALIRKTLFKVVLGTDSTLPWSSVWIDMLVLWLALFVAVNVFVYKNEGDFLWGHIRKNYCATAARRSTGVGWCTAWKWVFAFVVLPYACLRIFAAAVGSRQSLHTSCFITLDPDELTRYLKYVGWVVGLLVAIASLTTHYGT